MGEWWGRVEAIGKLRLCRVKVWKIGAGRNEVGGLEQGGWVERDLEGDGTDSGNGEGQ